MTEINIMQIFSIMGIGIIATVFFGYIIYLYSNLLLPFLKDIKVVKQYLNSAQKSKLEPNTSGYYLFYENHKKDINQLKISHSKFYEYLKNITHGESSTSLSIMVMVCIFCFGILIQEIASIKIDDGLNYLHIKSIKSKKQMRYEELIEPMNGSLTDIGIMIFNCKELVQNTNNIQQSKYFVTDWPPYKNAYQTEDRIYVNIFSIIPTKKNSDKSYAEVFWGNHKNTYATDKNFSLYVTNIYYAAKNWCYLYTNNIQTEIHHYEDRVNLAKSTLWLCLMLVPAVLFTLILFLALRLCLLQLSNSYKSAAAEAIIKEIKYKWSIHLPLALVTLIILSYLSYNVYINSSKEYNRRVLGTYIDHFYFRDSLEIK